MNTYVTGETVKSLRSKLNLTQAQLAEKLNVSHKTISKWETGKGLPDITLIEPLAKALQISVPELFSGEKIINTNRSANISRSSLYVCPVCGNIFHSTGKALISCCGITLPPLEYEEIDDSHSVMCEKIDGEHYITINHEMTKQHYISFIAYSTSDRFEIVKLYPEGTAHARFMPRGRGMLYWYCNRHGLFCQRI